MASSSLVIAAATTSAFCRSFSALASAASTVDAATSGASYAKSAAVTPMPG